VRGPQATVRITITSHMLDDFGGLTSVAFRDLRIWMWDIPKAATVYIDLGPLEVVDSLLIGELRTKSYASNVVFEARNWRAAEEYALTLAESLREAQVR